MMRDYRAIGISTESGDFLVGGTEVFKRAEECEGDKIHAGMRYCVRILAGEVVSYEPVINTDWVNILFHSKNGKLNFEVNRDKYTYNINLIGKRELPDGDYIVRLPSHFFIKFQGEGDIYDKDTDGTFFLCTQFCPDSSHYFAQAFAPNDHVLMVGGKQFAVKQCVKGTTYIAEMKNNSVVGCVKCSDEMVEINCTYESNTLRYHDTKIIGIQFLESGEYRVTILKDLLEKDGVISGVFDDSIAMYESIGASSNRQYSLCMVNNYRAVGISTETGNFLIGGTQMIKCDEECKNEKRPVGVKYYIQVMFGEAVSYELLTSNSCVNALLYSRDGKLTYDMDMKKYSYSFDFMYERKLPNGYYMMRIPNQIFASYYGQTIVYDRGTDKELFPCIDYRPSSRHYFAQAVALYNDILSIGGKRFDAEGCIEGEFYIAEMDNAELVGYTKCSDKVIEVNCVYKADTLKYHDTEIIDVAFLEEGEYKVTIMKDLLESGEVISGLYADGVSVIYERINALSNRQSSICMVGGKMQLVTVDDGILFDTCILTGKMVDVLCLCDGTDLILNDIRIKGINGLEIGAYKVSIPVEMDTMTDMSISVGECSHIFTHEKLTSVGFDETYPEVFTAIGYAVDTHTIIVNRNVLHSEVQLIPNEYNVVTIDGDDIIAAELVKGEVLSCTCVSDGKQLLGVRGTVFGIAEKSGLSFKVSLCHSVWEIGLPILGLLPTGEKIEYTEVTVFPQIPHTDYYAYSKSKSVNTVEVWKKGTFKVNDFVMPNSRYLVHIVDGVVVEQLYDSVVMSEVETEFVDGELVVKGRNIILKDIPTDVESVMIPSGVPDNCTLYCRHTDGKQFKHRRPTTNADKLSNMVVQELDLLVSNKDKRAELIACLSKAIASMPKEFISESRPITSVLSYMVFK